MLLVFMWLFIIIIVIINKELYHKEIIFIATDAKKNCSY